jgi:molybdate transport system substrate-binding protein
MRIFTQLRLLYLLSGLLFAGPLYAAEVSIAVAANFTDATRDLLALFEKVSGHTAKASFGSTGKLFTQIENGAPFEVFLAADTRRPLKAEQDGLAVPGSHFVYARGRLALWSKHADAFADGEAYLRTADFRHLAIANPKTAPYGLAAQQVMAHLGVWEGLQHKIVQGDSISQTFQFVATGNAEAGFIAYSQLKSWKGDAGTTWVIPRDYYAPIEQGAVLLNKGATNPAAHAFIEFMKSDAARQIILGYGYGIEADR